MVPIQLDRIIDVDLELVSSRWPAAVAVLWHMWTSWLELVAFTDRLGMRCQGGDSCKRSLVRLAGGRSSETTRDAATVSDSEPSASRVSCQGGSWS